MDLKKISTISCRHCPLREKPLFAPFTSDDVAFMERFKSGELVIDPGATILVEGSSAQQLYTVLQGMGVRYMSLANGERQVINFVLPGDFLGLQAGVMGEMGHSAEATTPMMLCTFNRKDLWQLFKSQPSRAYDLTWLAAVEEHLLGETVATLGRRNATERIAWALYRLHQRIEAVGLGRNGGVPFPYKQQDLADALGLSLVHTNKTLGNLRRRQIASWTDGTLTISDRAELARLGGLDPEAPDVRPLI